jgi:hypothetical protein
MIRLQWMRDETSREISDGWVCERSPAGAFWLIAPVSAKRRRHVMLRVGFSCLVSHSAEDILVQSRKVVIIFYTNLFLSLFT